MWICLQKNINYKQHLAKYLTEDEARINTLFLWMNSTKGKRVLHITQSTFFVFMNNYQVWKYQILFQSTFIVYSYIFDFCILKECFYCLHFLSLWFKSILLNKYK